MSKVIPLEIRGLVDDRIINTLHSIIRYLREMQKDYEEGKSSISGLQALEEMTQMGAVKNQLRPLLQKLIEDRSLPYEITIQK